MKPNAKPKRTSRISDKRRTAIYAAVHEPIMDFRVAQARDGMTEQADRAAYKLTHQIFKGICAALGVEPR